MIKTCRIFLSTVPAFKYRLNCSRAFCSTEGCQVKLGFLSRHIKKKGHVPAVYKLRSSTSKSSSKISTVFSGNCNKGLPSMRVSLVRRMQPNLRMAWIRLQAVCKQWKDKYSRSTTRTKSLTFGALPSNLRIRSRLNAMLSVHESGTTQERYVRRYPNPRIH